MTTKRNTINVQVWLSASQLAVIADYHKQMGLHTRRMSDLARTAFDLTCAFLAAKKGIKPRAEGDAIRYLEQEGYQIGSSKKYRLGIVKTLQEESLDEVEEAHVGEMIRGMTPDDLEQLIQKQGG